MCGAAFLSTLRPECGDCLIWKVNMSDLTGFDDKDLFLGLVALDQVGLPVQDTLAGLGQHRMAAQIVTETTNLAPLGSAGLHTLSVRFRGHQTPTGYTSYTQINFSTYSTHPIYGASLKCQLPRHEVAIINKSQAIRKYSTKNMHPFT